MEQSQKNLLVMEGIVFTLLGTLAVILPGISTLSIEILIGILFLIAGVVGGYRVLQTRHEPGFWTSLIAPVLSIIVGIILLANPIAGALTLTMILAIFFMIEGIAKILVSLNKRPLPSWGWILVSGIISICLALIILSGWPQTGIWAIGLIVGINMIFFGWSLIVFGLAAPTKTP